jgi:hypothetical protein
MTYRQLLGYAVDLPLRDADVWSNVEENLGVRFLLACLLAIRGRGGHCSSNELLNSQIEIYIIYRYITITGMMSYL